jgi:DNA (cytosine-5)-methyltransferase 1
MQTPQPSQVNHQFLRRTTLDKPMAAPTCISLFSGCGGMDLGVRQAGFEIRVMVEWDKAACDTLRSNWVERPADWREVLVKEEKRVKHRLACIKDPLRREVVAMQDTPHYWWQERPPVVLEADITKTATAEILKAAELEVGEADILTGGFPCQGFSVAGKRIIEDPRNQLYKECVRVLREALPRTFLFENVKGLTSMDGGRVIVQICNDFAASGYNLSWDVLDAADYGVPQHRERVFFIGQRVDAISADFGNAGAIPKLYMGAYHGEIQYPAWFVKKYPKLNLSNSGVQQQLPLAA